MSKNIFYPLVLLFCLFTLQAEAQRNNDDNEARPAKADKIFEILPLPDQGGYVTIYVDNTETPSLLRMELTGEAVEPVASRELSLVRRGLSAMIESAFIWDGQLTVITSLFYPGPQRDLLFMRRYSLPDLKEVDSEQIAEAYVPGRLRIPFGYALSPDSTRIMFYSWTYAVAKDPVKMEIHVLDKSMERQWSKRFLLPNKNANFYIYGCKVDNEGNAYLLCEDYKGKVGGRIQEDKIERFVLRLSENSSEATSFVIQLPDKVISDLQFTMDKAGNLYGGGIYKESKKINQDGVFAYRIDQKTQGYQKREIPISKEDYQAMHAYAGPEGKHVSGTRQFRNYFLDQVIWDEQGLSLIGEQRVFDSDKDRYGDLLVIRLDTSLRKQWALRIPKNQTASWTQPYFASYSFLTRSDKQYVVFNDHEDNMPTADGLPSGIKTLDLDITFNRPKSFVHLIEIMANGQLQHQNINNVINVSPQMALLPGMTRSNQKNTFLLYMSYLADADQPGKVFPISWVNSR